MTDTIIMFVHLMAAVVAAGSSVFGLFLLWPRVFSPGRDEPLDETSAPYKIIDLLAPTVFTCLLILIGSGVYYLMENYTEQVNLKEGYYNMLGIKLIFVVAAFLLSLYQTFGLRSKIGSGSPHAREDEILWRHHPGRHRVRGVHGHLSRQILAGQGLELIGRGRAIRSLILPAGVMQWLTTLRRKSDLCCRSILSSMQGKLNKDFCNDRTGNHPAATTRTGRNPED
jgi:uncharacterized membrane protein